jgi:hypothetical protein
LAYRFAKGTIFQVHEMRREPCLLCIKAMVEKINRREDETLPRIDMRNPYNSKLHSLCFLPGYKSETKSNEEFITKQLTIKNNKNNGMSSNLDGEDIPLMGIYKVNGDNQLLFIGKGMKKTTYIDY